MLDISGKHCINTILSSNFTGNIIPHSWYKKITTPSGKPSSSLINILAEILYWCRPNKDGKPKFKEDAWQTSYEHFEKKFCFSREALRKKFVRLEELNLVKREFRTIEHRGHKYNNVLFLHLNQDELLKITDIDDKKISSKVEKLATPSPTKVGDHIYNKEIKEENIFKIRSSKSSFVKKVLENFKDSDNALRITPEEISESLDKSTKSRSFQDFYPISQVDSDILSKESGRDFNLNFMNGLPKQFIKKYPGYKFPSKYAFISYFTKALKYEMRETTVVNNADYKLATNKLEGGVDIEKYLNNIENSKSIALDDTFKRKLAGVLDNKKAYDFISSIKGVNRKVNLLQIDLKKDVSLSEYDKKLVLEQAKAVYFDRNADNIIEKLELSILNNNYKQKFVNVEHTILPDNIWGKVRKVLIDNYGKEGVALDKSWFSIMRASIDEAKREIKLTAPTTFIKKWIEQEYKNALDSVINGLGFKLASITTNPVT